MNNKFEWLAQTDVVSLLEENCKLQMLHKTFKANEFMKSIISNSPEIQKKWTIDGVEAEVLRENKPWRKGKIKLTLEFCPDEPESPLDDIRKA